jgi:DNA-binding transcriptional regulator LsrR (DeoR family)
MRSHEREDDEGAVMPHRPTELVLTASVARRYYLEDRSKSEIADELGISRFRVARLLDVARRAGMVDIQIHSPDTLDTELSERLQLAYGLAHAVVLDVPDDDVHSLRHYLGDTTVEVLKDLVTGDDVLGVAWARSVVGFTEAIPKFAAVPVVQLTGALPSPEGRDVLEVVRGFARSGGGTPYVFYAPFIATDAPTARTLRRQADVARALALIPTVTVAAVGIGAWQPGLSSIFDALEPEAQDKATKAGVQAEVSGVLVDGSGQSVETPLARRIIGPTAEQLRGIREVVAVAYGDRKAEAIRSVLTGGWITGLVTHSSLARQLLSGFAE